MNLTYSFRSRFTARDCLNIVLILTVVLLTVCDVSTSYRRVSRYHRHSRRSPNPLMRRRITYSDNTVPNNRFLHATGLRVSVRTTKISRRAHRGPNTCGYSCCKGWKRSFTGYCTLPVCLPKCKNRGICVKPNKCKCQVAYTGKTCQYKKHRAVLTSGAILRNKRNRKAGPSVIQAIYTRRVSVPPIRILKKRYCTSRSCLNGGRCLHGKCRCTRYFTGTACQLPVHRSGSRIRTKSRSSQVFSPGVCKVMCSKHGTCQLTVNSLARCVCHPGYRGTFCTIYSPASVPIIRKTPSSANVVSTTTGRKTSTGALEKCYRQYFGDKCALAFGGLLTAEACCNGLGEAWGPSCTSCSQITGRSPADICSKAPLKCEHGECISTFNSYTCRCNAGYHLASSRTACIPNQPVVSHQQESIGVCFTSLEPDGRCSGTAPIRGSKAACCCSVGIAWGSDCDRCPSAGTVEERLLCPYGTGYRKVPSREENPAVRVVQDTAGSSQTSRIPNDDITTTTSSTFTAAATTVLAAKISGTTQGATRYPNHETIQNWPITSRTDGRAVENANVVQKRIGVEYTSATAQNNHQVTAVTDASDESNDVRLVKQRVSSSSLLEAAPRLTTSSDTTRENGDDETGTAADDEKRPAATRLPTDTALNILPILLLSQRDDATESANASNRVLPNSERTAISTAAVTEAVSSPLAVTNPVRASTFISKTATKSRAEVTANLGIVTSMKTTESVSYEDSDSADHRTLAALRSASSSAPVKMTSTSTSSTDALSSQNNERQQTVQAISRRPATTTRPPTTPAKQPNVQVFSHDNAASSKWRAEYAYVPKAIYARVDDLRSGSLTRGDGASTLQRTTASISSPATRSSTPSARSTSEFVSSYRLTQVSVTNGPWVKSGPSSSLGRTSYDEIEEFEYSEDINACDPSPCVNGGTCSETGEDKFSCECLSGFRGELCEEVDWCVPNPCEHGGKCEYTPMSYRCRCRPGFAGSKCETDLNECLSSPCVHGSCRDSVNGFACICNTGYTGSACESDIDECASENGNCAGRSLCVNTPGSYRCAAPRFCGPGFVTGDSGRTCEDINECADNATRCEGGTCKNTNGSFYCSCSLGYRLTTAGTSCEDIDECQTAPCGGESRCRNYPGSYRCECTAEDAYYDFSTQRCISSTPQRTSSSVESQAKPSKDPGRQSCYADYMPCSVELVSNVTERECCCTFGRAWNQCSQCPLMGSAAFQLLCPHGHGLLPAVDSFSIRDIDECELFGRSVACPNGRCVNSYGSFQCICYRGFFYNRRIHACEDFNECLLPHKCVGGTCINTIGSYRCECPSGFSPRFSGMGVNCVRPERTTTTAATTARTTSTALVHHESDGLDPNAAPCYVNLTTSMCTGEYDRNATYRDCCCSGGKVWGASCSMCPSRESEDFEFLCEESQLVLPSVDIKREHRSDCGIEGGCANGVCLRVENGYTCKCNKGFRLNPHTMKCEDVNECFEHLAIYQLCINGRCVNTQGSFYCQCIRGFRPSQNNPTLCVPSYRDNDYVNDRPGI